jgi:fimbrial isopeptide formation D2 family protein/LPXTG-motif cell wall-anchored protein
MKVMKKISALVIAMVMVLALALPAMAANGTIKTTDTSVHTYEIYQIFKGDADGNGGLTSLVYGENTKDRTKGAVVSQADITALNAIQDAGSTQALDQTDIASIAPYVDLASTPVAFVGKGYEASTTLPQGYYLIKDKDGTLDGTDEQYTLYIMQVLDKEITITPKAGTTTSVKKLDDVNDSTGVAENIQDSADYDIGDYVPYHLTAHMAQNVSAYKKYHLTFIDTLEAGKFDAITTPVIKVDGVALDAVTGFNASANYSVEPTAAGFTVTVTFTPIEGSTLLPATLDGKDVTIDFTAQLGEGANIGVEGNVNTLQLKYSNNPNSADDSEEGENGEDTVIVFTYELDVNKTDEAGVALKGATFALYKKYNTVPEGKTAATSPIKYDSDKQEYTIPEGTNYVLVGTISGTDKSLFEFKGIDDGEYLLVETVAPTNYNAIAPQAFTVTATHTSEADINKETKKDGSGNWILTDITGTAVEGFSITLPSLTKDEKLAGVQTTIENNSGATLPSTGGIGTTIFYVIGGVLVVLAGIVLVTRRKSAE